MNFHPDVLAAHAQFGGDLEGMQALYDRPDHVAEIARLQEQIETLGARLATAYRRKAECNDDANAERHLRLAAEAERDRLREALVEISERPGRMTWGEDTEYRQAARDMEDIADAALQKEPQP